MLALAEGLANQLEGLRATLAAEGYSHRLDSGRVVIHRTAGEEPRQAARRADPLERSAAVGGALMANAAAEELEAAARQRWIATECHRLAELGIGSPRERFAAGESIVIQRWVLGRGKTWTDDYIVEHPLVADRSIRWLSVDADDRVSVSQEGP